MPTYIVGDIHISDPASYRAHLPRTLATIARFGGRVVAGGGKTDLLEGDPIPERRWTPYFVYTSRVHQTLKTANTKADTRQTAVLRRRRLKIIGA
jgi:uncharacterized protein (DUF1330 family)